MRSLVILMFASTLSACAGMMLGGGASGQAPAPANRPAAPAAASDSALSQKVQARLAADAMLAQQGIVVRAQAGLVTLSGTVATYAVREAAEKQAMSVDGVKAVDNRISVNYTK